MLWQAGETPLHVACREDLLSVTQALCNAGCNVQHQNRVQLIFIFYLLKFINQTKNIYTVNAVKQAENRLVEWPTQG